VFLKKVCIDQYRNITSEAIELARHLTILYGSNGQGKTNILESIYLLGNARPFKSVKIPDLIQHTSTTATLRGTVLSSGVESDIYLRLENLTRRVSIDGKVVQRASELYGKMAVVIFTPDDTAMIKLGPETRRRFLDRSIYSSHPGFLQDYHAYYRTLKQRNALLKNNQLEGIDSWTEQLAKAGVRLMQHRQRYTFHLDGLLQKHYQELAGEHEKVSIRYRPDVTITTENGESEEKNLLKLLNKQQVHDIKYKTTGRGPHRDDLTFQIEGRPLKNFGSQGQQRSFVLALKMAEMDYLAEIFGEMPILLLDDIASELDRERMTNLLAYVRQRDIQVMITTTDVTPFYPVIQHDSKLYRVEAGRLTYEGNGTP
jgi:DNA replication and repair protein RecF